MEKAKINKINSDVVMELVYKSWELIRFNYPLTLTIMGVFIAGVILGVIPVVGALLGSVAASFIPLFYYQACRMWEKGEQGKFEDLMSLFKNKRLLDKIIPLLAINIALSAGPQYLAMIKVYQGFGLSFLVAPLTIILGLALPILFFKYETINFVRAIELAVQGLTANFIPFLIGFFIMMAISALTIVFCFLPFFAVGFPMVLAYNYYWYRVIYEDLVIEVKDEDII